MADLVINAKVLEDSAARLTSIKTEFDNVDKHSNADSSIWGQSDVRWAMGKFASDWKIHRQKISAAVGDLQKKVEEMQKGFTDTEQKLADSITTTHA